MPGHENSVSTTMAPDTMRPRLRADSATTGSSALRVACAHHAAAGQADRPAGRDEVLAEHVEQRRAHDHGVLASMPIVSVRIGSIACWATFHA